MAEGAGPGIAVTAGTGTRVGFSSCGDYQASAGPGTAVAAVHLEAEAGSVAAEHCRHGAVADYLRAGILRHPAEAVHHTNGLVVGGKGPFASFHHARHTLFREQTGQFFRRQIEKCGPEEAGIRMDVLLKGLPWLYIGEIAASLSGNHYLASGAGHLLKHGNGFPGAGNARGIGGHKSGCARSDYQYVAFLHSEMQITKKITIFAIPQASLAQSVEHRIRNAKVVSSILIAGS